MIPNSSGGDVHMQPHYTDSIKNPKKNKIIISHKVYI